MVHCIYPGVTGYNFQVKIVFLSMKIVLTLKIAISVDPNEMPHYVAFHLLPSTHIKESQVKISE